MTNQNMHYNSNTPTSRKPVSDVKSNYFARQLPFIPMPGIGGVVPITGIE